MTKNVLIEYVTCSIESCMKLYDNKNKKGTKREIGLIAPLNLIRDRKKAKVAIQ